MSLLNCEIYQRERVSTVVDTELILMIDSSSSGAINDNNNNINEE